MYPLLESHRETNRSYFGKLWKLSQTSDSKAMNMVQDCEHFFCQIKEHGWERVILDMGRIWMSRRKCAGGMKKNDFEKGELVDCKNAVVWLGPLLFISPCICVAVRLQGRLFAVSFGPGTIFVKCRVMSWVCPFLQKLGVQIDKSIGSRWCSTCIVVGAHSVPTRCDSAGPVSLSGARLLSGKAFYPAFLPESQRERVGHSSTSVQVVSVLFFLHVRTPCCIESIHPPIHSGLDSA